MMRHTNHPRPPLWAEIEFEFPTDLSQKSALIGHLSTFPSQCAISVESIDHSKFTKQIEGEWSIQEHLGHLLDLEELPSIRINEIVAGQDVLTPADMSNKATWNNDYNTQNMYDICKRFMQRRVQLVDQFNSVSEDKWLHSAYHERLARQMSILDLAYFQGQHDLYHHEMMLYLAGR